MTVNLSSLAVGSLTLDPEFDPDVVEYTATTTNATNKITAEAEWSDSTISIESEDATIATDGTATWETGDNVVEITVTAVEGYETETKTYTVTVTKS